MGLPDGGNGHTGIHHHQGRLIIQCPFKWTFQILVQILGRGEEEEEAAGDGQRGRTPDDTALPVF